MHVGCYQLLGNEEVHTNDHTDPKRCAFFNDHLKVSEGINENANAEIKSLIIETIRANSDVRMEVDEGDLKTGTAHYVAVGQALEVAMINFLLENGQDCHNDFIA